MEEGFLEGFIPPMGDLNELSDEERQMIMVTREGRSEEARIDRIFRDFFVWSIVNKCSDFHMSGRKTLVGNSESVTFSVRTPTGLRNGRYTGELARHFETKLFLVTGTPQGGSSPDLLSTRFSIQLPRHYAEKYGLELKDDRRTYEVDIRVEYAKTHDGYGAVCRLLDQQRTPELENMGLSYSLIRAIRKAVSEPSGLILVSGPTGSGKTTLLHAILQTLNDGQRSISTVENPVELKLRGMAPIKQIQIQGDITFQRALRSILRQDPDIILIGEIRDAETMEIAMQAAQTGHLVLSTIHANSAPETITRALDLTVDKERDAFSLADTLKFVIAQRLLDTYEGQSHSRLLSRGEKSWLKTNGLGFLNKLDEIVSGTKKGKVPIVEAIEITDDIKAVIKSGKLDTTDIYAHAHEQLQFETLALAGVRAVQSRGSQLRDCMTRLETNSAAEKLRPMRAALAVEYQLSLEQVARAIDNFCTALDEDRPGTIEEFLNKEYRAEYSDHLH